MNAKIVKIILGLLMIALFLWLFDDIQANTNHNKMSQPVYPVSVIKVTPESAVIKVKTTGITQSRWPINITANLSGKLNKASTELLPGDFILKDQIIAQIDDVDYLSEVATAKARISLAELNLSRYHHEQTVAKRINNNQTISKFGQFIPHIEAATAELLAAEAAHKSALKRLSETRIKAPFDGILLEKYIAPGMQINSGDLLFKLASADALDIKVQLSSMQWQQLNGFAHKKTIIVTDPSGNPWQATLRFINPSLDQQTRLRTVILTIAHPFSDTLSLLPEQQVDITIIGKELNNIVKAPASVLTKDNHLWTIKHGKLSQEKITIVDEQSQHVMFQFKSTPTEPRDLVLFPLSTMIVGQHATAKVIKNKRGL